MYSSFVTVCVGNDCIEVTDNAVLVNADGEPQRVALDDFFYELGITDFRELEEYAAEQGVTIEAVVESVYGREW